MYVQDVVLLQEQVKLDLMDVFLMFYKTQCLWPQLTYIVTSLGSPIRRASSTRIVSTNNLFLPDSSLLDAWQPCRGYSGLRRGSWVMRLLRSELWLLLETHWTAIPTAAIRLENFPKPELWNTRGKLDIPRGLLSVHWAFCTWLSSSFWQQISWIRVKWSLGYKTGLGSS